MIIDRLIYAFEYGPQSSIELEGRTRVKPEELLPVLKMLKEKDLIKVSPYLPSSSKGEEWNRTYYASLPLFWGYIKDPELLKDLRKNRS